MVKVLCPACSQRIELFYRLGNGENSMYLEMQTGVSGPDLKTGAGEKGERWYPGESWLWSGQGVRVAIDLGYCLGRRAGLFRPNITIFTHSDSDHVNRRTLEKFEESINSASNSDSDYANDFTDDHARQLYVEHERSCCVSENYGDINEFWLPLDWLRLAKSMECLAKDGLAISAQKSGGASNPIADSFDGSPASHLGEKNLRINTSSSEEIDQLITDSIWGGGGRPIKGKHNLVELERALPQKVDDYLKDCLIEYFTDCINPWRVDAGKKSIPKKMMTTIPEKMAKKICKSTVRARKTIAAVIDTAERLGVGVRWFEYELENEFLQSNCGDSVCKVEEDASPCWKSEGIRGVATILDARDTIPDCKSFGDVNSPHGECADALYAFTLSSSLTIQNSRALSVFLWPTVEENMKCQDGIIVWSDTQGRVSGKFPGEPFVPWHLVGIMSALHHASANNDHKDIWVANSEAPFVLGARYVVLSNNKHANCHEWREYSNYHKQCMRCSQDVKRELVVATTPSGVCGENNSGPFKWSIAPVCVDG